MPATCSPSRTQVRPPCESRFERAGPSHLSQHRLSLPAATHCADVQGTSKLCLGHQRWYRNTRRWRAGEERGRRREMTPPGDANSPLPGAALLKRVNGRNRRWDGPRGDVKCSISGEVCDGTPEGEELRSPHTGECVPVIDHPAASTASKHLPQLAGTSAQLAGWFSQPAGRSSHRRIQKVSPLPTTSGKSQTHDILQAGEAV